MQTLNTFRSSPARPEISGVVQHVFLIASPGAPRPRIVHRGNPLHSMQMVLVSAEDASWPAPGAIGPLPPVPPPQVLMRPAAAAPPLMPREITGTILRDARGRLYEKIGDHVRPVNQLCRDAQGQVIDLLPVRNTDAQSAPTRPADPGFIDAEAVGEPPLEDERDSGEAPHQERSFREVARQLAPEPGFWRVVRYADFIDAITPQLVAAPRLQPGHQLACYVQVYELTAKMALASLEQAAVRELGAAGKLVPLSYELCRRFGLSLPRPAFALAATQAFNSPGTVFPGARFVTLRVALDPTVDTAPEAPRAGEVATPTTPVAAVTPVAPTVTAANTTIPEEFGKPWHYHHDRDEILYDMRLAASRGSWRRLIDRLFHRVSTHDMKKWLAILGGKTTDQQLWAVKPPRGAFHDPRIRHWLEQTLQLGGYDVARMPVEWEIHWRRQIL